MQYIILDLEWNFPYTKEEVVEKSVRLSNEIIQIGAVKVDEDFHLLDTFKSNIKPNFYPKLHEEVKKLTNLTEEDLEEGVSFQEGCNLFFDWCGTDFLFLTWGTEDIPVLWKNMRIYDLDTGLIPGFTDVQAIYDQQVTHDGSSVALTKAAIHFNVEKLDAHDALHDAINTFHVCQNLDLDKIWMYQDNVCEYHLLSGNEKKITRNRILKEFPKSYNISTVYPTIKDALKDPVVTSFHCYLCGKPVRHRRWMAQGSFRYISIAECENDIRYFVRLKFLETDGGFRLNRIIYILDEEQERLYQKKRGKYESNRIRKYCR